MAANEIACLSGDVWQFLDDTGVELVHRYFDSDGGFSGAAYDVFAGGGDAMGRRSVFGSEDLIAVTLLDVEVPGPAALAILEHRAPELNALLADVPFDVDLWDADPADVDNSSSAAELWRQLKDLRGMGWVTVHKLVARKRPRLLPVYDSVVKAALQPDHDEFWLPLRQELQDSTLVDHLHNLAERAGISHQISPLRVLDVAVWMRNRRASTSKLPFKPCTHGH